MALPIVPPPGQPLPPPSTEVLGIHQSDIIIRTGLLASIADLRANPNLLDYCFASVPRDPLTARQYGADLAAAKKWFLEHDVPVKFAPIVDEGKWPVIGIRLVSSADEADTLSDIHYIPQELNDTSWPVMFGPFTPAGYDQRTGLVTPPPNAVNPFVLSTIHFMVDHNGKIFPITAVNDDGTFNIAIGSQGDFTNCVIKPERPALITQVESISVREVYEIGVHVGSEPVYLSWLHSVIVFCLRRYAQQFFEARGLERMGISSSDFAKNPYSEVEHIYSRYVTVTGYVRHYWPKATTHRISATVPTLKITGGGVSPNNVNPNIELWIGDQDSLGAPKSFSISGVISGATSSGVIVSATGIMTGTTTASGGLYSISGLANGSYILTPSKPGYTFSPASIAVTINGSSVSGQNFTAFPTSIT